MKCAMRFILDDTYQNIVWASFSGSYVNTPPVPVPHLVLKSCVFVFRLEMFLPDTSTAFRCAPCSMWAGPEEQLLLDKHHTLISHTIFQSFGGSRCRGCYLCCGKVVKWTDRYLVSWSRDAATSRGREVMSQVSLVGVRRSNFLSRLDTPVGRNTFLIVRMETRHFRLGLDSFRVKKVALDTYDTVCDV